MKRGRKPKNDYPREEFIANVQEDMRRKRITQTSLAKQAAVNKGTLSDIFSGDRPASVRDRFAIARFLGWEAERIKKFCGHLDLDRGPRPHLDDVYDYSQRPELVAARALRPLGFYESAALEAKRAFDVGRDRGDILLGADAAGRMAVVHLEIGNFQQAVRWSEISIQKCCQSVGLSIAEILLAAGPCPTRPTGDFLALRILSDSLHNYCQAFVRQILYFGNSELERRARQCLTCAVELDRRMGLSQPLGNNLRCRAVLEAATNSGNRQLSVRLIDEANDNFPSGGFFQAHSIKTRGIIHLATGRLAHGRDNLLEAEKMLQGFTDLRGLALTMYMTSDAILRTDGDHRQALRHMLAATVLHPHTFVLDRCRMQARAANRRELQTELDNLVAGKGNYASVHLMLAWVSAKSDLSKDELLLEKLHSMRAGGFPEVAIPERPK